MRTTQWTPPRRSAPSPTWSASCRTERHDVFVVDLSDNVAGRFCAKLLGMGGADVVRPRAAERTASVPFLHAYLSASTRSTTTTDPVDTLIADADVVVT